MTTILNERHLCTSIQPRCIFVLAAAIGLLSSGCVDLTKPWERAGWQSPEDAAGSAVPTAGPGQTDGGKTDDRPRDVPQDAPTVILPGSPSTDSGGRGDELDAVLAIRGAGGSSIGSNATGEPGEADGTAATGGTSGHWDAGSHGNGGNGGALETIDGARGGRPSGETGGSDAAGRTTSGSEASGLTTGLNGGVGVIDAPGAGGTGGADAEDESSVGVGSGSSGAGGSATDGTDGATTEQDLVLWYKFDESGGTTAADSASFGGTARNASLATVGSIGGAAFSTSKQVGTHAVTLTPSTNGTSGGYVILPSLHTLAPSAMTIAVWVNLASTAPTQDWERIFDFGTGSAANNFLYLVARAGDSYTNAVQFVISTQGHSASVGETINSPNALTPNAWHHVAIVLPAGTTYTGTMYIDGKAAATNSAMSLHASDIGATTNNWLGRSQYSDALFSGSLDDFRVYKRALSSQEISDLFGVR